MSPANIFNNRKSQDLEWTKNLARSQSPRNASQNVNGNGQKIIVSKDLQKTHFTFGSQKQFVYLKEPSESQRETKSSLSNRNHFKVGYSRDKTHFRMGSNNEAMRTVNQMNYLWIQPKISTKT